MKVRYSKMNISEKDILKAFEDIKNSLQKWNNLLLYPSGQLYSQWFEVYKMKKIMIFCCKKYAKRLWNNFNKNNLIMVKYVFKSLYLRNTKPI